MEISFANKGIYHYMDARIGTMPELEDKGLFYQLQMLTENKLPYILPSSMLCSDGEVWLSHNTGQCYNLHAMLTSRRIDGIWLKRLLRQLADCMRQLEEYLIDPESLVVRAEYMFYDAAGERIQLLCVPGYAHPVREQLCALLEMMMPRFDHSDQAGERFLYECHAILTDEWQDLAALLRYIEGEEGEGHEGEDRPRLPEWNREMHPHEETGEPEQSKAEDTVFSKRFFLFVLGGGAALSLIVKYLFFDGTTGTAIFGIIWLLALVVLAIMTVRDKEERESDAAMQAYRNKQEQKSPCSSHHGPEQTSLRLFEPEQKPSQPSGNTPEQNLRRTQETPARLVPLTNGALEPFRIPAHMQTFTVGRDKSSDYRVATTQISRIHARIFSRPDGLYIEDQNSTNGTFINTKRIPAMTQQKLEKGDVVGFANEEFFIS